VVLNFFAGACAPCRAEMPAFQKVADEYQGRVIFVGVDVGPFTGLGTHDDAARLLKDLGIRYPAGYAVDATPLALYVLGMPTTVVFDARGQLVTKVTGTMTEAQLVTALQSALGS
jgi:thiol-disulfide isomerase/thioredoxin